MRNVSIQSHLRSPIRSLQWQGPFRWEIRWKSTQVANIAEHQSGCERLDDTTVSFHFPDLLDVLNLHHRPDSRSSRPDAEPLLSTAAARNNGAGVPS